MLQECLLLFGVSVVCVLRLLLCAQTPSRGGRGERPVRITAATRESVLLAKTRVLLILDQVGGCERVRPRTASASAACLMGEPVPWRVLW